MPPGDTQYPAHRFGGDRHDSAAGRPAILDGDGGTVRDGLPLGDAQYPARLSGRNPKDNAERSAVPDEDGGAAEDDLSPGDTQSLAHRSQGEPQEIAAGQPGILGKDDSTVPDAMQPGAGGAPVVSTQSPELIRPQTQPLAPVLTRYAARPLGQGACMRHSSMGKCKTCGATVNPIHILMGGMNGVFCERCCPVRHSGA
jgi:hypothetical protein